MFATCCNIQKPYHVLLSSRCRPLSKVAQQIPCFSPRCVTAHLGLFGHSQTSWHSRGCYKCLIIQIQLQWLETSAYIYINNEDITSERAKQQPRKVFFFFLELLEIFLDSVFKEQFFDSLRNEVEIALHLVYYCLFAVQICSEKTGVYMMSMC